MAVHEKQITFVQLKLCISAFNLKKGIVCMPQEITAITGRFAFCACGHNPTEGANSILQHL